MNFFSFNEKINAWRIRYISGHNFLLIASVLVGMLAGLAAVFLKVFVHYIQQFLHWILEDERYNFLLFVFPLIGILITVYYVQRFMHGKLGRGVGNILYAVARKSSNVEKDKIYSHGITSAITVGFGGSAGLEAPIVVTGAAIGSNTARWLKMNYRERTLLLACGVAAGIAAIFNSPIAGVLFAVEVILYEFAIPVFIPLLIASATATVISKLLYSGQLFFLITTKWEINALPYYILLGIGMGLFSVYVTRALSLGEKIFASKKKPYRKAVLGGIALGVLIFLFPPLYGEGYFTVEQLLNGKFSSLLNSSLFTEYARLPWFVLLFAMAVLFIKIIATAVTIGSGGNGGIFAPSLFIGALAGFVFAYAIELTGITSLTISNFIVAGMAGALSGVVHAPLTAIFLIAEITGGYVLFVPLMIVSALSYFITRHFEPYSIYMKKLVKKGFHKRDRDRNVLHQMKLKKLVEKDFIPVKETETLGELVKKITHTKRNVFPVINEEGKLIGIVLLDNIREIMFHTELYPSITVHKIMTSPPAVLDIHDEMYDVMKKFDAYNAWNLPVTENKKYIGFVSKSAVFSTYRLLLIQQSEQQFS